MRCRWRLLLTPLAAVVAACAGHPVSGSDHAAASLAGPMPVRLSIDGAPPTEPVQDPRFGRPAIAMQFPLEFAGHKIELWLDRVDDGPRREWLHLWPKVPANGELVLNGLPAGGYEVRARLADRDGAAMATGAAAVRGTVPVPVAMQLLPAAPTQGD